VLRRAAELDDPSDWDYWKREALAYEAGLLVDLADGFVAPRCYGIRDLGQDHVAIWLEDIVGSGPSRWPLERYGLAARHLGRFNGAYLTGRRLPGWPWLSVGRVRQWLARGRPCSGGPWRGGAPPDRSGLADEGDRRADAAIVA
jgi:hypothetical protein